MKNAFLVLVLLAGQAFAQIENQLVVITPASKALSDSALADFAKYAAERWNVTLKWNSISAGTPIAYGRITEWAGKPQADVFWAGETPLFDKLAEKKLLAQHEVPKALVDPIPATIGKPKPVVLKDPGGHWVGTLLEPIGIVYHPRLFQRLGVPPPKDWDDLLNPKLRGNIAQSAPTRSSSSHAAYEVILQRDGDERGWEFLKKLAAYTGLFTARSRDVPSVVAKGEFAAGFAVPSYMAFDERSAGYDIRFVAPKTAWLTQGPVAVLAGAPHPRAARAFAEYLLSPRGQRIIMENGLFPIHPKIRMQGAPGSAPERAVEFNGGVRSFYDLELQSVYDEDVAQARYEQVNARFRSDIEAVIGDLRKKY